MRLFPIPEPGVKNRGANSERNRPGQKRRRLDRVGRPVRSLANIRTVLFSFLFPGEYFAKTGLTVQGRQMGSLAAASLQTSRSDHELNRGYLYLHSLIKLGLNS